MKKFSQTILSIVLILAAVILAGCGVSTYSGKQAIPLEAAGNLQIKVLDIGQGDAILIRTKEQVVLVDTGDVQTGAKLVNMLKQQGITTIDKVFITHPHADHLGGVAAVLNNFQIKHIYDSGQVTTSSLYKQYLNDVKQKNIPFSIVSPGDEFQIGQGVALKVLAPMKPLINESALNNNSVVIKVSYGNFSMLLPSDAETEAEKRLVDQYGQALKSTVLKSGHHGSSTSSSTGFLDMVKPEAVVISLGKDNDYHHPHPSTIKKYESRHINIYRTDVNGTVTINTDGKQYRIEREKVNG